jgi:hypothetical protein
MIPHGLDAKQYTSILNLQWDGVSAKIKLDALTFDVEPEDAPGAEIGVQLAVPLELVAGRGELEGCDEDDWVDALGEALTPPHDNKDDDDDELGEVTPPFLSAIPKTPPPLPPPLSPPPLSLDDPPGPGGPAAGYGAASSSGDVHPERPIRASFFGDLVKARKWGAFNFNPEASGGKYGGFRIRCPFHKLNQTSDCKKWIRVLGPTDADKEICVRRMMLWCVKHTEYNRQRHHVAWDPPILDSELPDLQSLKARRVLEAPARGSVTTDVELNALGPEVAPPPAPLGDVAVVPVGVAISDDTMLADVVDPPLGHAAAGYAPPTPSAASSSSSSSKSSADGSSDGSSDSD